MTPPHTLQAGQISVLIQPLLPLPLGQPLSVWLWSVHFEQLVLIYYLLFFTQPPVKYLQIEHHRQY